MPILSYIVVAIAAYLLGSIPAGFLVAKVRGIDIRAVGSGNIGATNAMRVLGKPSGIFVLLLDAFKGWYACHLGIFVCFHFLPEMNAQDVNNATKYIEIFPVIAGIFAVLGHNYPCWLKFKGGKGVATTAGVYLALAPEALGIALAAFVLAVLVTRYVSVGSIVAAIVLPATVWIMTPQNLFLGIVTSALGLLAIYKHKSNIQRLMTGTENRLGKSAAGEDARPTNPKESEGAK